MGSDVVYFGHNAHHDVSYIVDRARVIFAIPLNSYIGGAESGED
jgi:hypothetical protein